MRNILLVINIVVCTVAVILILLQNKGGGLGSAYGGGGQEFQTRRGVEKITMRLTIIFIAIFFIVSVTALFVK